MGRRVAKRYSTEEVRAGLTQLALCSSNAAQASRRLKASGTNIPRRTLEGWKRSHADELAEIRHEVIPRIHAAISSELEEVSREATALELRLIEDIERERPNLPAKELGSTLRNVSVTKGISLDKVIGGKLTVVHHHEHRGAAELLAELETLLPPKTFDAEAQATELPSGSTEALPNTEQSTAPLPDLAA